MTTELRLRSTTTEALQKGVINPFHGSTRTLIKSIIGNFPSVSMKLVIQTVLNRLQPTSPPRPHIPPSTQPVISASFAGSMTVAQFTVTGSGFLPNLQGTKTNGVAIKVVDANALIETRREFASTDGSGALRPPHVITGDISGLVVNAAGIATIAFSATDGRSGPGQDGFLDSNTVRINFP